MRNSSGQLVDEKEPVEEALKAIQKAAASSKRSVKSSTKTEKGTRKLQKEAEQLREENKDLKDQLLRKLAEFDNFRKRTSREYAEIIARANEKIIRSLLPVLDDLGRSLNLPEKNNKSNSFRKGIEHIYSNFHKLLEDAGLRLIETEGKEFDPNIHEAMMHLENPDVPSNHIIDAFEKGYYLNDKVVRHAKVSVSK